MSENYDVIAIFPIYDPFRAIPKQDSRPVVTIYLTKTENKTKKSLTQFSHSCFVERYYFGKKKKANFLQKVADISNI